MKKVIASVVLFVQKQSKRTRLIALGIFMLALIPATALALKDNPKPIQSTNDTTQTQAQNTPMAASATTETPAGQNQAAPTPPASTTPPKPASTKPAATQKPVNTGDEHKQHPTPGPAGRVVIRPLIVSQTAVQLQAGQTVTLTANGSGSSISPVNIDYSESSPALENHLRIDYTFPLPAYAPTQTFKFAALASAAPGTYSVRLTVGTETETMNSANPVFYRATLTVTVLP